MRIAERMGLVYTALFLTVSVAVITQNSDTILAAFRGEANIRAVDDIFTVQAGRAQRLFVLTNDVNAAKVTAGAIHLLVQPNCGTVSHRGGSFMFDNSAACSGRLSFSYCLDTGAACEPAAVTLRIADLHDPVSIIESGPATDPGGFERQLAINAEDLEISNVHLGRGAVGEGAAANTPPAAGAKLGAIAVEPPPRILFSTGSLPDSGVEGTFSIPAPGGFADAEKAVYKVAEVSAAPVRPADATPEPGLRLPRDPASRGGLLPAGDLVALTQRLIEDDAGFVFPEVSASIDASPFGTPCESMLRATAMRGGFVQLTLTAGCRPNSRVLIRHGKLTLAYRTGHSGALAITLPALEDRALFSARFDDGTVLKAGTRVPDVDRFDRVAIEWRGQFALSLRAVDPAGRAAPLARLENLRSENGATGQGYIVALGSAHVENPVRALVYSRRNETGTKPPRMVLTLKARPSRRNCGSEAVLRSIRTRSGRVIGASGFSFRLPDCDGGLQSVTLDGALRNPVVAAR